MKALCAALLLLASCTYHEAPAPQPLEPDTEFVCITDSSHVD